MIKLERLTSNNREYLKELHQQSLYKFSYDKNFFCEYEKMNFLGKILSKKFFKLLKIGDKYIGYIWFDLPLDRELRIWALYVMPRYIEQLDDCFLKSFNNYKLVYEGFNENNKIHILNKLGFEEDRETILMYFNLDIYKPEKNCDNYEIETFKDDFHEEIRCKLQNEIFYKENRVPLTVDDIKTEIVQHYYIKELSLLMKVENEYIGYGQIIYSREMYIIVNVGIKKEYRRKGNCQKLLQELLLRAKENNIKKVYIRVEKENIPALKLYEKIGFNDRGIVQRWVKYTKK